MKKNNNSSFIFIVVSSLIFIMVLAFGSAILTKNNSVTFENSGYIISANKAETFLSGTTYRLNLNKQVVFTNDKGNISSVNLDSFIHYDDKSIAILKNGAFVDLTTLNSEIVPYYNITNKSIINYSDGKYFIKNGGETLTFESILIRISENKYLITGKEVRAVIPGINGTIDGDFFEITYIADGVVLIENSELSYEVTASGTRILVGDDITLDLGNKNVLLDGETKVNLTQITIDGNENISIVPDEKTEEEQNNEQDKPSNNVVDENENNNIQTTDVEENIENNDKEHSGENTETTESENKPKPEDNEVSLDLVRMNVGINDFTGVFQINNAIKLDGKLSISIKNISTGSIIEPIYTMTETGYLSMYTDKLESNTNYMLSIKCKNSSEKDIEYYQRVFNTDSYGFNMKKVFVSDSEIEYEAVFAPNSTLDGAKISLFDMSGNKVSDDIFVSRDNNIISFKNLVSNSEYTLVSVSYNINGVNHDNQNGYIKKTVKTLKKTPKIGKAEVNANENNSEFVLSLTGITDEDSAITNYTYLVYEYTNLDELVYKVDTTSPTITLKVGENGIKSNQNYRYKVIAEYNDNEIVREFETNYSDKFVIAGATVNFDQDMKKTTFNTITGTLTLRDPDCTIPMPGREECSGENHFNLVYYIGDSAQYKEIEFTKVDDNGTFEAKDITISKLSANTTYWMELRANMIIKEEVKPQVIIGKQFSATTNEVENLKIQKKEELLSTDEYPINLTVSLDTNTNSTDFINQVKTLKVKLYYIDKYKNKVEIGNTRNLNNAEIIDLLYKKDCVITNKFFGIENIEMISKMENGNDDWISSNYVIEFTDAYDTPLDEISESSNRIDIENNEVNYTINKHYLLNYYAKKKNETAVRVKEITNKNNTVKDLSSNTTIGYTVSADIFVEDILREYYGTTGDNTINWNYVYKIYKYNRTKGISKNVSDEERLNDTSNYDLIYSTNNIKYSTYSFYLDDDKIDNFDRGGVYYFSFQIVTDDGVYPENEVVGIIACDSGQTCSNAKYFNPIKENPTFLFTISKSGPNSITYMYKITKDIDSALYGNSIYLEKQSGQVIAEQTISKKDEFGYITFNSSELVNGLNYKIAYNKINDAIQSGYSEVRALSGIFDGYYVLNGDFTLDYRENGNSLNISINNSEIIERSSLYGVKIKSLTNSKVVELLYAKNDLKNGKDISIDYALLEDLQGLNTEVSVTAYYDNGLTGLEQVSEYFVLKNNGNTGFLSVDANKKVQSNSTYSGGIYKLAFENDYSKVYVTNLVDGRRWNTHLDSSKLAIPISITNAGTYFGTMYGTYNPKVISVSDLTSDNKGFFFSSIIPMVSVTNKSKINQIDIKTKITGLTKTIVENEFKNNDKKIYIELSETEDFTNKVINSVELNVDNLTKDLTFTFDNLKPDTNYFYKVYANILSKDSASSKDEYVKTYLYDYNTNGSLVTSIKSSKTLGKDDILKSVDGTYKTETSNDQYAKRSVTIKSILKTYENFDLSYKVADANGIEIFTEKISTPNSTTNQVKFDIDDDNYVFGAAGYTAILKAITKDENKYELVLYNGDFIAKSSADSKVSELEPPTLNITNIQTSTSSKGYSLSFDMNINDKDYVMDNGEYYVKLYNSTNINESYLPVSPTGLVKNSDGYVKLNRLANRNPKLTFEGLAANATYIVSIKSYISRNNASLPIEDRKSYEIFGGNLITTGNKYNVSLGTGNVTANDNIIKINYNNDAKNLSKITKIDATIYKNSIPIETVTRSKDANNIEWFTESGGKWSYTLTLSPNTIYSKTDSIILIVTYYAEDLDGIVGEVGQVTYTNY